MHLQKAASDEAWDDAFDDINPGSPRPLLQAGIYPARWIRKDIRSSPWGEKLIMHWLVFSTADIQSAALRDDMGTALASYYNVKRDNGQRPKFGPLHSYRKDWIAANHGRLPAKPNSLSLSVFKDRWLFVEVQTVKTDQKGELHPSCWWSKVHRVIRPVAADERISMLPLELSDIAWKRE